MKHIKSINWIFTYKCNLKCIHCDIWNNPYKKELSIEKINEITKSKIVQDSYVKYWNFFDIAISWWEPLLIKNLEEIMLTIDRNLPWSIHSISTNWILTEKLIKLLVFWQKKWKSFRKINISIDGNEKTHDIQRWISWSFRKSIETVQAIKKLFPKQIIEIKLTITKNNYKDILFISKLANKLWVFFSFKPAENILNYTNQDWEKHKIFSKTEINEIENQIIYNPYIVKQDKYITKRFFYKIPNYLINWLWEEKKICSIANDSITIMPDWKIYSCILMSGIWNIYNNSINEIWQSNKLKTQRKIITKWKCHGCMLMCWLFKNKEMYAK